MICKEGKCDRADDHASLHVLGNRQTEQVTQSWSNVRRVDRWHSAPGINPFSEKNKEALRRSFCGGVPRFTSAEESLYPLKGPGWCEAKGRNHRDESLIVGCNEEFAKLPVDKLHHQLEEQSLTSVTWPEGFVITPGQGQGIEVNPDVANIRFKGIDRELDPGLISHDGGPDS